MAGDLMALVHKYDSTKYADRKAKIQAAKDAVSALDNIIANVEGSTVAQSQQAIKQLAQHQRALIRIVAGEVI